MYKTSISSFYNTSLDFEREVCAICNRDYDILSLRTDNKFGRVDFDFGIVFDLLLNKKHDGLIMIHSHPPGVNRMSRTDYNMAYGWAKALGVPITYIIVNDCNFIEYIIEVNGNEFLVDLINDVPINSMSDVAEGPLETICKLVYGFSKISNRISDGDSPYEENII